MPIENWYCAHLNQKFSNKCYTWDNKGSSLLFLGRTTWKYVNFSLNLFVTISTKIKARGIHTVHDVYLFINTITNVCQNEIFLSFSDFCCPKNSFLYKLQSIWEGRPIIFHTHLKLVWTESIAYPISKARSPVYII